MDSKENMNNILLSLTNLPKAYLKQTKILILILYNIDISGNTKIHQDKQFCYLGSTIKENNCCLV